MDRSQIKVMVIANGKVFFDGKDVTPEGKEFNIEVHRNIDHLQADICSKITVNGSVEDIKTKAVMWMLKKM